MPKVLIEVLKCGRHGFNAVAVSSGKGGGQRVTPSKCCGAWAVVQAWKVDPTELRKAIDAAERGASREVNAVNA
jgi:hypothetical protein